MSTCRPVVALLATALAGAVFAPLPACAGERQPPEAVLEMQGFMELMQQYIVLTEHFQRVAADPHRAAAFAVFQLKDLVQSSRGADNTIKMFKDLLKKTDNGMVRNLINLQLAEMLKDRGRTDDAVDVLTQVILDNAKRGEETRIPDSSGDE